MKKLHFNCFVVIFTLLLCTFDGFTQQRYTRGAFTEPGSRNTEAFREYMQESNDKNAKWLRERHAKRQCYTYQQMFDSLRLYEGETLAGFAERRYIEKGDSVRIKFVFNNRIVQHISIMGVQTQLTDIKNGVFVATVKPEKSGLVDAIVTKRSASNKIRTLSVPLIIMVFDSEEYKKVDAKVKKFEEKGDADGRAEYLFSLERKLGLKLR